MHDQWEHLGGAQKDTLDTRGRASLNTFLLRLFENAGCAVDLASTTWRLGPGRGGTVSGSHQRNIKADGVPRLHSGSSPYDTQYTPGHRASECAPVEVKPGQHRVERPWADGSFHAGKTAVNVVDRHLLRSR